MFKLDVDVSRLVDSHEGSEGKQLTYLPWAAGLGLAGCPQIDIVEFEGHALAREIFGGAAVAAEIEGQRVYLPVQDDRFHAIPYKDATPRDIGDTQSRCRAKVLAMCTGVGLCVYADFKGDGPAFAKAVGPITPETDLLQVKAMVARKPRNKEEARTGHHTGPAYLQWPPAIAAAKLADEAFRWKIEERESLNVETGEVRMEPFTKLGTGYAVGVTVTFRGGVHTEWLPILGTARVQTRNGIKLLDNQPILEPNLNHWNKAVMRCLVKAIAVKTGYGLSVYAKSSFVKDDERPVRKPVEKPKIQPTSQSQRPSHGEVADAKPTAAPGASQGTGGPAPAPGGESIESLVERVNTLAAKANVSADKVLGMLNVDALNKASPAQLTQVGRMLERRAMAAAKRAEASGSHAQERQEPSPQQSSQTAPPPPADAEAKGQAGSDPAPEASGDTPVASLVQQVRDLATRGNMPEDKLLSMLNVTSLDQASQPQLTQVSRMLERRVAAAAKRAESTGSTRPPQQTTGMPAAEQSAPSQPTPAATSALLQEVLGLAKQANLSQDRLCSWMEVRKPADADEKALKKVKSVLKAMIAKGAPEQAAA